MGYFFAAVLGYLLGCANLALVLAKRKHVNLTAAGSGNPGASNVTVLLGWRVGILVAIHDGAAGTAPVSGNRSCRDGGRGCLCAGAYFPLLPEIPGW